MAKTTELKNIVQKYKLAIGIVSIIVIALIGVAIYKAVNKTPVVTVPANQTRVPETIKSTSDIDQSIKAIDDTLDNDTDFKSIDNQLNDL
jgi:hypothetical protein